jgi:hypothetical protein
MYKIKKKDEKKHRREQAEMKNQLFLNLGFPVCPNCKRALTSGFNVDGTDYLQCTFCGETVRAGEVK